VFGNLGLPELIFIFILALLIFGPKKLPETGRTIGRGLSEFRRASTDLRRSLESELEEADRRAAQPPPKSVTPDPGAASAPAVEPAPVAPAALTEPRKDPAN